jgi:hypothetical protein
MPKQTRPCILKMRLSKRERDRWQRAADDQCEGNLSRYVRKVVNDATAPGQKPSKTSE